MIQVTWWGFAIVLCLIWAFGFMFGYALGRSRRELTQREILDAARAGIADAGRYTGTGRKPDW